MLLSLEIHISTKLQKIIYRRDNQNRKQNMIVNKGGNIQLCYLTIFDTLT